MSQTVRTMDQHRAEFALKKIKAITEKKDPTFEAEVRRYIPGLPALIHMNGLGQAMAFYRSKGDEKKAAAYLAIYNILCEWLCDENSKGQIFQKEKDLLTAITQSDMRHYMAAQNEAQALLEWLKKFAIALLKKEDN